MALTRLLLEYRADPCLRNEYGDTPLHISCFRRNLRSTELLLQAGANPNEQNTRRGETPLHVAMNTGSPELVELLVGSGARLDIPNHKGELPLQKAGSIDHQLITERISQLEAQQLISPISGRPEPEFEFEDQAFDSEGPESEQRHTYDSEPKIVVQENQHRDTPSSESSHVEFQGTKGEIDQAELYDSLIRCKSVDEQLLYLYSDFEPFSEQSNDVLHKSSTDIPLFIPNDQDEERDELNQDDDFQSPAYQQEPEQWPYEDPPQEDLQLYGRYRKDELYEVPYESSEQVDPSLEIIPESENEVDRTLKQGYTESNVNESRERESTLQEPFPLSIEKAN